VYVHKSMQMCACTIKGLEEILKGAFAEQIDIMARDLHGRGDSNVNRIEVFVGVIHKTSSETLFRTQGFIGNHPVEQ
jgi:hypothetical protein